MQRTHALNTHRCMLPPNFYWDSGEALPVGSRWPCPMCKEVYVLEYSVEHNKRVWYDTGYRLVAKD